MLHTASIKGYDRVIFNANVCNILTWDQEEVFLLRGVIAGERRARPTFGSGGMNPSCLLWT